VWRKTHSRAAVASDFKLHAPVISELASVSEPTATLVIKRLPMTGNVQIGMRLRRDARGMPMNNRLGQLFFCLVVLSPGRAGADDERRGFRRTV
jgi:hypothetical protein